MGSKRTLRLASRFRVAGGVRYRGLEASLSSSLSVNRRSLGSVDRKPNFR